MAQVGMNLLFFVCLSLVLVRPSLTAGTPIVSAPDYQNRRQGPSLQDSTYRNTFNGLFGFAEQVASIAQTLAANPGMIASQTSSASVQATLPPQFNVSAPVHNETTPNSWPGVIPGSKEAGFYFYGLTYSPFGLSDNQLCPPFDVNDAGGECLLASQVAIDMLAISKLTSRVKTYSTVCVDGLDQILKSAQQNGMTVMLGLWITNDPAANNGEILRMIPFLNKYGEIITDIVVGNEPFLERNVALDQMIDVVKTVQKVMRENNRTSIKLGIADIYNVWMNKPTDDSNPNQFNFDLHPLVGLLDWIGMNGHAYWTGLDPHTGRSVSSIYDGVLQVGEKYNKTVVITETGYPTAGDSHTTNMGTAFPSLDGLSIFLSQMERLSREKKVPVYMFEPYDGDWKRRWEPFVEMDYNFGLATCNRVMKNISLPERGAL